MERALEINIRSRPAPAGTEPVSAPPAQSLGGAAESVTPAASRVTESVLSTATSAGQSEIGPPTVIAPGGSESAAAGHTESSSLLTPTSIRSESRPFVSEPVTAAAPHLSSDPRASAPGGAGTLSGASPKDPSPPSKGINVTPSALEYAKKKLAARGTPEAAIRLGVRGGGCAGYTYAIEFADEPPRERDRLFEFDGVRFYVDKKSLLILAGSVLDFERTLMFQGFKFRNPQAASSCGCGQSFTIK